MLTDKIRVGVLRGGPSSEYQISLETGKTVLENLSQDYYDPIDIFISREGVWYEGGLALSPLKILKKIDVVYNALHGFYGEDGTVQKILEGFAIPYTGSGALSSSFGLNKIMSRQIYKDNQLKVPYAVSVNLKDLSRQKIYEIYKEVPAPFVVKPSSGGSSIGVSIAHSLAELEEAVISASTYSPAVLVEEYINGKEVHCGVIDGFRGTEHYAIKPFSTHDISTREREGIEDKAILAHTALGLRHYSSSDFIIHPKRGVFILETDSQPALGARSPFMKSLESVGSKISEFLHHIINLALIK